MANCGVALWDEDDSEMHEVADLLSQPHDEDWKSLWKCRLRKGLDYVP